MSPDVLEKKKYTYEDYLRTPEGGGYELIEGELIMTPAPIPKHQRISRKIAFFLDNFANENNLGEVLYAPCDVYIDNENVVQPDILFISKERAGIIGEKNIQGAPELVIEIISESTAYRDFVDKKRLYAKAGVKEYWLVIPEEQAIEVHTLTGSNYSLYKVFRSADYLDSPLITGLKLEVKKVF